MFKRICWMLKRLTKLQSFTSLMQKRCILFSMITRILCGEQLVLTCTTLPGCSQYPQAMSPRTTLQNSGECLLLKPNTCKLQEGRWATGAQHMTRHAGSLAGIKLSQCELVFLLYFRFFFFFLPVALGMLHIYAWEIKKRKKSNYETLKQYSKLISFNVVPGESSECCRKVQIDAEVWETCCSPSQRAMSLNTVGPICIQESLFYGWVLELLWFSGFSSFSLAI